MAWYDLTSGYRSRYLWLQGHQWHADAVRWPRDDTWLTWPGPATATRHNHMLHAADTGCWTCCQFSAFLWIFQLFLWDEATYKWCQLDQLVLAEMHKIKIFDFLIILYFTIQAFKTKYIHIEFLNNVCLPTCYLKSIESH